MAGIEKPLEIVILRVPKMVPMIKYLTAPFINL